MHHGQPVCIALRSIAGRPAVCHVVSTTTQAKAFETITAKPTGTSTHNMHLLCGRETQVHCLFNNEVPDLLRYVTSFAVLGLVFVDDQIHCAG